LRGATLTIFGDLDNNFTAEKNAAAWKAALEAPRVATSPSASSKRDHIQLDPKSEKRG